MGLLFTLLLVLPALPAPAAEPPGILNAGPVETRSAPSGLEGTFRSLLAPSTRTTWIGYTVPAHRHWRGGSCGEGDGAGGGCCLSDAQRSPESLPSGEAPARLRLLFAIEGGHLRRLRTSDADCRTDLCGQPLVWLTEVAPRESVDLLASLLGSEAPSLASSILAALALHAEPQAIDILLGIAHRDTTARVRGQALFWLAQHAGERATAGIKQALAEDPDVEVKKKAVFALSQLPKDRGIPLLIETARTNPSPGVRRQAMFWLGQSNDARALAFFEDVLKR